MMYNTTTLLDYLGPVKFYLFFWLERKETKKQNSLQWNCVETEIFEDTM